MVFTLALLPCLKYNIYTPLLALLTTCLVRTSIDLYIACYACPENESPGCYCGPGTTGGIMGTDDTARVAPSMRLPGRRGCGSGGSGLPQRPAQPWLQVRPEPDRGHQGLSQGKPACVGE